MKVRIYLPKMRKTGFIELDFLLTFKLGMWGKRREGNDFGGNTPLNMLCVLGQKEHPSIPKILSGAAVVVQHRQVSNHCYVLAIWEQLETTAIICQGQQFVGAMAHYDVLALQLKVSWSISLHLLWDNTGKKRLLFLQFQGKESNL